MEKKLRDSIKAEIGDDLCAFCPWSNGDIETPEEACNDAYCDDAYDNFLAENSQSFDDDNN